MLLILAILGLLEVFVFGVNLFCPWILPTATFVTSVIKLMLIVILIWRSAEISQY